MFQTLFLGLPHQEISPLLAPTFDVKAATAGSTTWKAKKNSNQLAHFFSFRDSLVGEKREKDLFVYTGQHSWVLGCSLSLARSGKAPTPNKNIIFYEISDFLDESLLCVIARQGGGRKYTSALQQHHRASNLHVTQYTIPTEKIWQLHNRASRLSISGPVYIFIRASTIYISI